MKLVEADRYLARQAVLSPYVTIRKEAARLLRSRPPESYAPMLLESLHTPIQSRVGLFVGRSGIRLTRLLLSETQDVRQLAGWDSRVVFRSDPLIVIPLNEFRQRDLDRFQANQENRSIQNSVVEKQLQAYAQQRAVDLKNDQLNDWNDRIFAALREATGLKLRDDAVEWWNWWDDFNHVQSPDSKPYEYVYYYDERERVTHQRVLNPPTSCLVAGTPIWTDRGFVSVEQIEVGDLVLSKHPRTGELTYQPVLKTTLRPPVELVAASFGSSTITCTIGHTFWASGTGWQKIRDLHPGTPLHTADGFKELSNIEESEPRPTHNLVVADFHTYFIGKEMLFSHDVTFAEPLNNTIPGGTQP
jgi:hypothetical protein